MPTSCDYVIRSTDASALIEEVAGHAQFTLFSIYFVFPSWIIVKIYFLHLKAENLLMYQKRKITIFVYIKHPFRL